MQQIIHRRLMPDRTPDLPGRIPEAVMNQIAQMPRSNSHFKRDILYGEIEIFRSNNQRQNTEGSKRGKGRQGRGIRLGNKSELLPIQPQDTSRFRGFVCGSGRHVKRIFPFTPQAFNAEKKPITVQKGHFILLLAHSVEQSEMPKCFFS